MSSEAETISVVLFNKNYNFRCPSNKVEALYAAARELNDYFNKLDKQRNLHNRDELIMLTALNFVGQLRELKAERKSTNTEGSDKIQTLRRKIEEKLANDG
jgi:cell division protein ZapA (FtsZ GTPase activity inhibitor)